LELLASASLLCSINESIFWVLASSFWSISVVSLSILSV
jgi:hypothetical protein